MRPSWYFERGLPGGVRVSSAHRGVGDLLRWKTLVRQGVSVKGLHMRTLRGGRPGALALGGMLCVLLLATAVQAGPILGSYDSSDLSGLVETGRWTEGFKFGTPNTVGNGAHAASWNAGVLGAQWELIGPTIASTTVIYPVGGSPVPPPTGMAIIIYQRVFDTTGATLTLTDTGPWWNAADPGTEYVVDLTLYEQTLTVTYVNGAIANASSIETFQGDIQGYPGYQLLYGHTVGAYEDYGLAAQLPANYPSFFPVGSPAGAWGVAEGIRFDIVPEPSTMALLGMGVLGLMFSGGKKRR